MKKLNCILLIDDNTFDNEYHTIIINKANVCNQIKVALDGEQALTYIKNSGEQSQSEFPKPDILFLDINMPRMNGFEFLEEYHKLDKRLKSKVLVAMLTTSLNLDDEKRALNFGEVIEYLIKPLTVEDLNKIIDNNF